MNKGRLQNSLMTQPLMNTPLQLGELASVEDAAAKGITEPFSNQVWAMWFGTTAIAAVVFWFLDAGAAGENFSSQARGLAQPAGQLLDVLLALLVVAHRRQRTSPHHCSGPRLLGRGGRSSVSS